MTNSFALSQFEQGLKSLSRNPKIAAQFLLEALPSLGGIEAVIARLNVRSEPKQKGPLFLTGSAAAYTKEGKRSEHERHLHAKRCEVLLTTIPDDGYSEDDVTFVQSMLTKVLWHHARKQEKWLHDLEFNFEIRDEEWVT